MDPLAISGIQYTVALNTDYSDLSELCLSSKTYRALCTDPRFWQQKALNDFKRPLPDRIPDYPKMTNRLTYLYLYTQMYGCTRGSETFKSVNTCLFESARDGNDRLVDYFLSKGGDINLALNGAEVGKQLELGARLVRMGATGETYVGNYLRAQNGTDPGMIGPNEAQGIADIAALNGRLNVIKSIRYLGSGAYDPNRVMLAAVRGGDLSVVNYVLNSGANNIGQAKAVAKQVGNYIVLDYLNSVFLPSRT